MRLAPASISEIANISDLRARIAIMRSIINALRPHNHLQYAVLNLVAVFIDGLVAAPPGKNRALYTAYLRTHFPALHAAMGADDFYTHYRCKAVHEFSLAPGYAIGRGVGMGGAYIADQPIVETGETYRVLNIDRLTDDFLQHLHVLETGGGAP